MNDFCGRSAFEIQTKGSSGPKRTCVLPEIFLKKKNYKAKRIKELL